ncbi:hypothetical protein GCM10027048_27870 [Hymenobacter coalescens]
MAGVTTYTQEIADAICERIALGESLRRICQSEGMPAASTVFKWLSDVDGFSEQYGRAREFQAETMMDEILEISDDATNDFMTITKGDNSYEVENKEWTSRSKLRVDARLKLMAQLAPKKYGPRMSLSVKDENPIQQLTDEELLDEIRKLAPKE